MDDDLLIRRLRAVDGDAQPRREFVDALHDDLAARLGFASATAVPARRSARPVRGAVGRRWLLVAAVLALLLVASANLAAIGAVVDRLFQPTLLETIQSSGRLRIAIRPDDPQSSGATGVGGAMRGFDVDVASAIGEALGVDAEVVATSMDDMLDGGSGGWQIAFPSRAIPSADADRFLATGPYYRWPVYVVVDAANLAVDLGGLAGATVCVVPGSAGAAWLAQDSMGPRLDVIATPPPMVGVEAPSDAACLDELAAGRVTAVVTDRQIQADLDTRDGTAIVGEAPVAMDPSAIIVATDAPGAAPLRERLDAILDTLRRDGTIRDLSQRWFGGEDLTNLGG